METEEMEAAILKLVGERPYTSFVELSRLPEFTGDQAIRAPHENLYIWLSVSKTAAAALTALLAAEKIKMEPASTMTYMIDGAIPKIPVAKRLRAYKTPHWLPVTLQLATSTAVKPRRK